MPKHLTRAEEMDKAFLMAKLFREPYFTQITRILREKKLTDDETARMAFIEVYNNAFKGSKKTLGADDTIEGAKKTLNADYADWLWNYLNNYDPKLSAT